MDFRPGPTQTNKSVQPQKIARNLKFWIQKVEELFDPCSENKGADQLRSSCEAVCAFVFAYADCWFSHAVAKLALIVQRMW